MHYRFLFIFLLLPFLTEAQEIRLKRCVIATAGGGGSFQGTKIRSTLGQPPIAGTGTGASIKARQGFQQPLSDGCAFAATASFDFAEEMSGTCGTSYDFEYTGTGEDGSTSFSWDFGLMGFPQFSTDRDPAGVSFSQPGTYTVALTVTTGECAVIQTQTVEVTDVGLGVNAVVTPITCANAGDGGASLEVQGGTAPFTYAWSNGTTDDDLTRVNPGMYSYTVTDANGCIRTNSIELTGNDSLEISTTVTVESCFGEGDGSIVAEVDGGIKPYTYAWSNDANTPELTGIGGGTYELTVTDAAGCSIETGGLTVLIECDTSIPDIITPNGDGVNDSWVLPNLENRGIRSLKIFNRWGQPIFTRDGYDNSWAGTNNSGEELPLGAYFYVIEQEDGEKIGGSITIVR